MVKFDPRTGKQIADIKPTEDITAVVDKARSVQQKWANESPVSRGERLLRICDQMQQWSETIKELICLDTGKSEQDAAVELGSAIQLGRFFAGEGQRLYGRTTTSAIDGRWAMTIREPVGVAGLITAYNMPIANIAWKLFPALICGNIVVVKPSDFAPLTAEYFIDRAATCLPRGVLNLVQGDQQGAIKVIDHVDMVSFTGSAMAGWEVAKRCAERHIKCSLELGGKNAFVVCDDADMIQAVNWAVKSAYSLGGQRCTSASRIIVFKQVYDEFVGMMKAAMPRDTQPVIGIGALTFMLQQVGIEIQTGAKVIFGGYRMKDDAHRNGYYMSPTLIEGTSPHFDTLDLFGPIATLHKAHDLDDAIRQVNDSPYGLTACIHTQNMSRAMQFVERVQTGVVSVNAGTYGSEPHMPFGGLKDSGNGTREPGTEALDVYSNWKTVYLNA